MKTLISVILVVGSLNVSAATVNDTLNVCFGKAVGSVSFSGDAKETLALMNERVRDCKESVADQVRSEKEAKKLATNAKRIEKLQKQLAKLTK